MAPLTFLIVDPVSGAIEAVYGLLGVMIEALMLGLEILTVLLVIVIEVTLTFVLGQKREATPEASPLTTKRRVEIRYAARSTVAVLAFGLILFLGYSLVSALVEAKRQKNARRLVESVARQAAKNVDEDGNLIPRPHGKSAVADPWGKPIQIEYGQSFGKEVVAVTSAGPDGLPDTADDIDAWASPPQSLTQRAKSAAKQLAEDAISRVSKKVREVFDGPNEAKDGAR